MARTIKDSSVIVDSEGVRFGEFCFINHDAILKGRGPLVRKKYLAWLGSVRKKSEGCNKTVIALNVDRALTPELKTR